MLPAVIYPAATLARGGDLAHAQATLPLDDGRWIRIEAAPLDGDRDGDIAVTIRAAAPAETFDVACRAHGLTPRETAVVAALYEGVGTREVAHALHLSDWTVQDHLKSVFAKLDVHSRREALARLAAHPAGRGPDRGLSVAAANSGDVGQGDLRAPGLPLPGVVDLDGVARLLAQGEQDQLVHPVSPAPRRPG